MQSEGIQNSGPRRLVPRPLAGSFVGPFERHWLGGGDGPRKVREAVIIDTWTSARSLSLNNLFDGESAVGSV